jgi:hypothetical protein
MTDMIKGTPVITHGRGEVKQISGSSRYSCGDGNQAVLPGEDNILKYSSVKIESKENYAMLNKAQFFMSLSSLHLVVKYVLRQTMRLREG